jgi:hypothetical protein
MDLLDAKSWSKVVALVVLTPWVKSSWAILLLLSKVHVTFFLFLLMLLTLPLFFFSAAIMSGYAQLMNKTGGMTKKGKKESPAQNLV